MAPNSSAATAPKFLPAETERRRAAAGGGCGEDQEAIVADSDTGPPHREPAAKPQDYDFYTLLPGDETA